MNRLFITVLTAFTLLLAVDASSAQTEEPNIVFTVIAANDGRAVISLPNYPEIEWVQVYIGIPEQGRTIHTKWYENTACAGTTCTIVPTAYPGFGSFSVYIRPWGSEIGYFESDMEGWFGPRTLQIETQPPNVVTGMEVAYQGGNYTLTWAPAQNATWYQVWVGRVNPVDNYLQQWLPAEQLGCDIYGVCTYVLSGLPEGPTYGWFVQAWGPGGMAVGGENGWAAGPALSPGGGGGNPSPGFVLGDFGIGGQVDWFRYPDHMRNAGMTWVKRQISYSQGMTLESIRDLVYIADQNGFNLVVGIVGNKDQLASNRDQFIQDYAEYVGEVAGFLEAGDAIEVWNEPNLDREWPQGQISGANYTQLLSAAYTSIKNRNPEVMVISAAPAPTGVSIGGVVAPDDTYIREMAASGAANYMDCVGVHYNEGAISPSASSGDPRGPHYSRYYPKMVDLYSSTFPGIPLCFTELGYLTPEGLGSLPPSFGWASNTTLENQANWLGEVVCMAKQDSRVHMVIVWNVDFTRYDYDPMAGFAIVRPDGSCPACARLGASMSQC